MLCCAGLIEMTVVDLIITLIIIMANTCIDKESGTIQITALLIIMVVVLISIGIEGIGQSDCTGGIMPHNQLDSTAVK